MEVVGLAISAIAFVDSAIKTGTTLARVFRDYGEAGKQMYNTTQRLEAQKYTLDLWQRQWQAKAFQQCNTASLEDGFRQLWGEDGHVIIVKCLAQLNVKFGEAFRALRSIDPDSFGDKTTAMNTDTQQPADFKASHLGVSSKHTSRESASGRSVSSTESSPSPQAGKDNKGKKSRWYKRLSTSENQRFWRKKWSVSATSVAPDTTPDQEAELAQQALRQKLSPGTKFQWSVSLKEQIRSLINDIDDWLALLQTLASQSETEFKTNRGQAVNNPSSIRAAAKALYIALGNNPSGHDLDFKLEKERADSGYFEQVVGPLEYLDPSNRSFKFPLLVSSNQTGEEPFLLLAEAIYSLAMVGSTGSLDKETPLGEIVQTLRTRKPQGQNPATTLLFRSQQTTIVIHEIAASSTSSPTVRETFSRCSFAELLRAETGVDPLVARWKRLQLACIIAISVLHLYETGWISEHLETNDFHFFGPADSQYHELHRIAPYVSAVVSKSNDGVSPFECMKRNQIPLDLRGTRDDRLATLFHRLGTVLFELGRGVQHREVFGSSTPSESEVLAEVDKIPFGRPYRDVVKVCLTGSLYAASAINIDSHFDRAIIEKLTRLEQHFSAILHGDM